MTNARTRSRRHIGRALLALGATGVMLAATAASAGAGFSPPHYLTALGPHLFPVAVADFNRDGRRDIVVGSNTADGHISILYGKKGGGFQPYVDYPGGAYPFAIATADFNGDHRPDIAVGEYSTGGGVGVLLSKHGGGFTPVKTYKTGDDVYSIAVADFNHDGNPDIVAANEGSDTFSVLLGRSNGTFKHRRTRPTDHDPVSLVAGDFNHDGKQDVAVLGYRGSNAVVQVFLGTGKGKFKSPRRYVADAYDPEGMVAGQFTADHNLDLAVPSCNGPGKNKVFLLDGKSNGSFEKPRGFANDPGSCSYDSATGDLNRDGRTDLVTAVSTGANEGDVSVLYGKKRGKLSGPHLYNATSGDDNYSVVAAAINGDKRPDLVVPDYAVDHVAVLYGTG